MARCRYDPQIPLILYNHLMNLDAIIAWVWENKEIIGLFAVIATALGTIYHPTRDLLKVLPKIVWAIVKYSALTVWAIIWPIRKPIAWAYTKFLSDHVYNFLDRIFDCFEKRETAKEKLRKNKNIIETIDL